MKNRHRLLELAAQHDVPVKKPLKTWVDGRLVVLELDRPTGEIVGELRDLGFLS